MAEVIGAQQADTTMSEQVRPTLGMAHHRVLWAVAQAMFPSRESELPPPDEALLRAYFDQWITRIPPRMGTFLKLFWIVFEFVPPFFVFRFRRFSSLGEAERVRYLNAWSNHWFYWCRMAGQLQKSLIAMAYFSDPAIRRRFKLQPIPITDDAYLSWRYQDD